MNLVRRRPALPTTTDCRGLQRERILSTAQALFYGEGVRATGIDRIIAQSAVTKVTFYRQFASKDALIEAFLKRRHAVWIADFRAQLSKHREAQSAKQRRIAPLEPLLRTGAAIMHAPLFRGCAFANTVAEVGPILPSVLRIAVEHKREVCDPTAALLPPHGSRDQVAWAATVALDGTLINAQANGHSIDTALKGLETILNALNATLQG